MRGVCGVCNCAFQVFRMHFQYNLSNNAYWIWLVAECTKLHAVNSFRLHFFPCLPSLSLSSSKEYCFVHSMYCVRSYMQSKQANSMPQTKYYEHINSGIMYVHSIPMHSLILLFLARCSSSVIVVVVFAIVCENTELISTPDQQPHFRIGEHARRSCNVRSHAHSSASDWPIIQRAIYCLVASRMFFCCCCSKRKSTWNSVHISTVRSICFMLALQFVCIFGMDSSFCRPSCAAHCGKCGCGAG